MPSEVFSRLQALGRTLSPEIIMETQKIYAPYQRKEPYAGVKVERDRHYGSAPRQRLDVLFPETGPPRPVLLFVHGGGFVGGDKSRPGSPFYDNVALWAVDHGLIGINMTYRFAPDSQWPSGVEDVSAAVDWIKRNAVSIGADPDHIFIAGHSAGAAHVAGYVARAAEGNQTLRGISGVILMSGIYDITTVPPQAEAVYYGPDPSAYAARSPFAGLLKTKVPLFLAVGEIDLPEANRQASHLFAALCSSGDCPRFYQLAHHTHMSEVYHLGTDDERFGMELDDFVRTHLSGQP